MNVIIAAAAFRFKDIEKEVLLDMFGKALAGAADWNGRRKHPSICEKENELLVNILN